MKPSLRDNVSSCDKNSEGMDSEFVRLFDLHILWLSGSEENTQISKSNWENINEIFIQILLHVRRNIISYGADSSVLQKTIGSFSFRDVMAERVSPVVLETLSPVSGPTHYLLPGSGEHGRGNSSRFKPLFT